MHLHLRNLYEKEIYLNNDPDEVEYLESEVRRRERDGEILDNDKDLLDEREKDYLNYRVDNVASVDEIWDSIYYVFKEHLVGEYFEGTESFQACFTLANNIKF